MVLQLPIEQSEPPLYRATRVARGHAFCSHCFGVKDCDEIAPMEVCGDAVGETTACPIALGVYRQPGDGTPQTEPTQNSQTTNSENKLSDRHWTGSDRHTLSSGLDADRA